MTRKRPRAVACTEEPAVRAAGDVVIIGPNGWDTLAASYCSAMGKVPSLRYNSIQTTLSPVPFFCLIVDLTIWHTMTTF